MATLQLFERYQLLGVRTLKNALRLLWKRGSQFEIHLVEKLGIPNSKLSKISIFLSIKISYKFNNIFIYVESFRQKFPLDKIFSNSQSWKEFHKF